MPLHCYGGEGCVLSVSPPPPPSLPPEQIMGSCQLVQDAKTDMRQSDALCDGPPEDECLQVTNPPLRADGCNLRPSSAAGHFLVPAVSICTDMHGSEGAISAQYSSRGSSFKSSRWWSPTRQELKRNKQTNIADLSPRSISLDIQEVDSSSARHHTCAALHGPCKQQVVLQAMHSAALVVSDGGLVLIAYTALLSSD